LQFFNLTAIRNKRTIYIMVARNTHYPARITLKLLANTLDPRARERILSRLAGKRDIA